MEPEEEGGGWRVEGGGWWVEGGRKLKWSHNPGKFPGILLMAILIYSSLTTIPAGRWRVDRPPSYRPRPAPPRPALLPFLRLHRHKKLQSAGTDGAETPETLEAPEAPEVAEAPEVDKTEGSETGGGEIWK